VDTNARLLSLSAAGLVHPHPKEVTAPLFLGARPFFLPDDKVQVKYEMLRAHLLDGLTAVRAATIHGYSRAALYLILDAFRERGMLGLLDERRGRKGPVKVSTEIRAFLAEADRGLSGAELVREIERRFGVGLHRRTVERARRR
jgi:transposase